MMQPPPRRFQLLEIGVMQDQIDLLRQLVIDLRDERFDALVGVVGDGGRLMQGLFGERLHRALDGRACLVRLGSEFLREQLGKFALCRMCGRGACACLFLIECHWMSSVWFDWVKPRVSTRVSAMAVRLNPA